MLIMSSENRSKKDRKKTEKRPKNIKGSEECVKIALLNR